MTLSLQARLHARVERAPHRRALAFLDSEGDFVWQSFEQVYHRAADYGGRLADLGIAPGDVCLLVLPSNEFCASLLLATLLRGGVPLLVAPPILQAGPHSSLLQILKGILRKTDVRLVIAHKTLQKHCGELEDNGSNARFVFGEDAFASAPSAPSLAPIARSESDTAALQLTSGTTGVPRICRWQQR